MPLAARELGWWTLVLAASVATAWLTLRSPQLGCTAAVLTLGVGLYVVHRPSGLVVVWLLWLLAPWLRRVFGLAEPLTASDPLALAPFLLTSIVIALEVYRAQLSRFAVGLLLAASAGYLIGVPAGLGAPAAMLFALFAYVVAMGCFVLGYREPPRFGSLTLPRVLTIAVPGLALYSIFQYIGPLPAWDDAWLRSVQDTLDSVGAPEEGRIRVFGTLNSPGTFAAVLGLTAVCLLAAKRLDPLRLLGLGLVLAGLLLTYVRGAWVSLVAAGLIVVLASRGRASGRLVLVGGLLVVALAVFAGRGDTGQAIVGRADTLGRLNSDISAQARVETPLELVPEAVTSPLGHGLGSAGEATRLGTSPGLRDTDNGYLSLVYQTGPLGFLLVLGAAAAAGLRAVGNLHRHRSAPIDVLVLGLLGYFAIGLLVGDLLYGVTGMIFWYLLGVGVRRSEDPA